MPLLLPLQSSRIPFLFKHICIPLHDMEFISFTTTWLQQFPLVHSPPMGHYSLFYGDASTIFLFIKTLLVSFTNCPVIPYG